MKQLIVAVLLLFLYGSSIAQEYKPALENIKARQWFNDARFGLFIHWGPFSIPGAGEWVTEARLRQLPLTSAHGKVLEKFLRPIPWPVAV